MIEYSAVLHERGTRKGRLVVRVHSSYAFSRRMRSIAVRDEIQIGPASDDAGPSRLSAPGEPDSGRPRTLRLSDTQ